MVQEVHSDDDGDDEFEPLFSYQRVCRPPSEDDSDDDVTVLDQKGVGKRTGTQAWPSAVGQKDSTKETENDDDDWLPPPPKSSKILDESKFNEDPTLREIRQAREEFMRIAESRIQKDDKNQKFVSQMQEIDGKAQDEHDSAAGNREKVLLSIQNKDGACKSFRQFKDEKFGKLFSKYAELIGVPPQQLVFLFDGQKILEHNTPKDFDLEDEDIIEANIRT